jgi:hypothetical protein
MFQASITVTIGDGHSAKFWTDPWLPDGPICRFAPHLFNAIPKRRRGKSVRDAITNRSWVRDIRGALVAHVFCDYVLVWHKVDGVLFDDLTSDRFIWRGCGRLIFRFISLQGLLRGHDDATRSV